MDEVEQTIRTYDKIASQYCKKTRQPRFLEWEENYIKKLLSFIHKPKPIILDVGCGDGRHCIIIEKSGGMAIGIDLSQGMLEEANRLYPEGDFREMDMRILSFVNDFFDGIWASGSIYHVPKANVNVVIEEFRRILKLNGILAVNFKLGKGKGMEAEPKSYSGSPRYFAYYTEKEMKNLLSSFGFEEMESCSYPEEIFGDNIQQMWFKLKIK